MVGWLNSADVKEETPVLYDDFDPLKEWLIDPDPMQLQNPCDYNNFSPELCGNHYGGVKIEQEDQMLESSIDLKMEKVGMLEISDGLEAGEVSLKENGGGNDGEINCVKPALETLDSDQPLQCKIGVSEGKSEDEEGSTTELADSDCGNSSSDESSSDVSSSIIMSTGSEYDVGMEMREEVGEFEEGEVREFDAPEIDFLSDEEEEGPKGPIRSEHEVKDLPPLPMVDVSLEPHHQLLPVGVILSVMMNNRVIVEGSVKHNPLDEGSILWMTDTRTPLGLVDEIFGPVKNPYYVVRYNSEEEVPAGVEVGISVSFVMEFASQILNDKALYKKGYDASGDNDEEVDNDLDFSDDEKEAEYKKSLHQGKRVANRKKGMKQEIKIDRKRSSFMKPRIQHKDMQKQQTYAPLAINQPRPTNQLLPKPTAFMGQSRIGPGSWNSSGAANATVPAPSGIPEVSQAMQELNCLGNSSQQLHAGLAATSRMPEFPQPVNFLGKSSQQLNAKLATPSRMPEFPQAMQAVNFLGNSSQQSRADLAAPSRIREFPQARQAVSFLGSSSQQSSTDLAANSRMPEFSQAMRPVSFLGNSSQQLFTSPQEAPWLPGISPQVQSTGLQSTGFHGDLHMQLHNQNLLLNNLVNMMAFQQQLQQFIPHQGNNLPQFGAASSLQPLGQNNFAPPPRANGFVSVPGPPGPGNEQIQGQAPPPFAPYAQFNAGNSSSLNSNGGNSRFHGRPFHRGGGHFFGQGGRRPNRE